MGDEFVDEMICLFVDEGNRDPKAAGLRPMSFFKMEEVLAFARMTMHFFNNGGDPDFRQDRNP